MSIIDLQAFLQERLTFLDNTIETAPGSKADTLVIQPTLRRIGPDPFSVDVRAFLLDRLNQEFPSTTTQDGDALTDLLVKPAELFLDPIVRENSRVRQSLSLRDPSALTLDEAEALGGNFFIDRNKGKFSKGLGRVYFAQPQSVDISPANFFTSRAGLTFFPDGVQSIQVSEMLFNLEGSSYYFDVNVIAEQAGDQYNIEPGELVAIANLNAAVRVTNKSRFQQGVAEENSVTYLSRVQQELTQRSLVTKRGIVGRLSSNFPDMTRINVVGFNDPEMQRDVIEGGGLGPIKAGGLNGFSISDTENKLFTRRFSVDTVLDGPVDFTTLIGPTQNTNSTYVLTMHGLFVGAPPVKDFVIRSVVNQTTLDLEEQVMPLIQTGIVWEVRKHEITLSKIPGGIIFPDSPNGTVAIPDGQIHIGGTTDTLLRGTVLDTDSLILSNVVDDRPVLSGNFASSPPFPNPSIIVLTDLILFPAPGANYNVNDDIYNTITNAAANLYEIQIVTGPAAGTYRITAAFNPGQGGNPLASPIIQVLEVLPPIGTVRWRLIDEIDVDLVEPKETRVSGSDMSTFQANDTVTTTGGLSFVDYGVAIGDVVRIFDGPDKGDFVVQSLPVPSQLQLDRPLLNTKSNLRYIVFLSNPAGGVSRPLVRVKSVDLLDSSGQAVGSTIPFANPLGAYSFAFSSPGKGVKVDVDDARLGVVGIDLAGAPPGANVSGKTLQFDCFGFPAFTVTFVGVDPIPLNGPGGIVAQINAISVFTTAVSVNGTALGLLPVGGLVRVLGDTNVATSAIPALFGTYVNAPAGTLLYLDSQMVRAIEFEQFPNFFSSELSPPLDVAFDVLQTLDGNQIGFYRIEKANPFLGTPFPSPILGLTVPPCVSVVGGIFAPELDVRAQIGARSIGRARVYFLDPTSIEFESDSVFTASLPDGSLLRYFPDFSIEAQHIPALPSGVKPSDGSNPVPGGTFHSSSTDFVAKGIKTGDVLVIDYVPITGTVALADPVLGLAFTTIIISFSGVANQVITFVQDSQAIPAGAVTRAGVVSQINSAVGKNIVSLGPGNFLKFNPSELLIIRDNGTANVLLGLSVLQDTSNQSPNAGRYNIQIVALGGIVNDIFVDPSFTNVVTDQQFSVFRPGTQRVGTTQMSLNVGPAGLYFMDVDLVSEGTGIKYDLDNDIPMTPANYRSDGFYLTTDDTNLSFSTAEPLRIRFSRTVNEVGTDDDPQNATQVTGQQVQLNYELSSLTAGVQGFVTSELERVVCASPLARHLIPHFIRFDLQYSGGPKEADIKPDVERLIQALFPDQQLEVSDITAVFVQRGSDSIQNPITLYGVVYNQDRTVTLERSEDRINVGRLAAFIPDVLNLTRNLV